MRGEITLRKTLEEYKTVYMAYRNFAERTREEYLNDLEDLVEFLGRLGIDKGGKISLATIERYLAELERRGFAGATRKRKTVTIRSFLTFLYKDGYIGTDLARQVIPPFVENKTPQFLTEAEYNRLREACAGNPRDRAIIEILLQTGIRLSELTRLSIDDVEPGVDEPGGQQTDAYVRIKGNRSKKDRIIPLNDKAQEAIKAYLSEQSAMGSSILFLNRFGQPYGDRGVQKMLRRYLKQARIERGSVHTLRHTFGTHHTAKGISVKILQEVMGHKDPRSTSIYVSIVRGFTNQL